MFEKWDKELRKKVKDDERLKGDILVRVIHETFQFPEHTMHVEEVTAREFYDKDLERADLEDFLKVEREYGRSD